jgi:hypothetical protein
LGGRVAARGLESLRYRRQLTNSRILSVVSHATNRNITVFFKISREGCLRLEPYPSTRTPLLPTDSHIVVAILEVDQADQVFGRGGSSPSESEHKVKELHAKIGELTMERDFLEQGLERIHGPRGRK